MKVQKITRKELLKRSAYSTIISLYNKILGTSNFGHDLGSWGKSSDLDPNGQEFKPCHDYFLLDLKIAGAPLQR